MRRGGGLRLFYATDLHGSEVCFRKFLSTPKACGVDVLLLGGDIVGRSLVVITRTGDGYAAEFDGRSVVGLSSAGLAELTAAIRRRGEYFVIGTSDDLERLGDAQEFELALRREVSRSLEAWAALAEERLNGTGVRLFVMPAGQDPPELDSVWEGGESVVLTGDGAASLDDTRDLVAINSSVPTPSRHPREVSELEMRARLHDAAAQVGEVSQAVLVVHTPPYNCALDQAPLLDDDLVARAGPTAPVGSIAVRDFIESHQPLLAAHGQVHESNGSCRIGATLCVNPGSRANEGALSGALVDISDRGVRAQMLFGQ